MNIPVVLSNTSLRSSDFFLSVGRDVTVRIIAEKGVRLVVEFKSGENVASFMMELKKAMSSKWRVLKWG